jgi:shikimate kinase
VVLVGFMGSGKTTVGMEVARRLGWSFLDMDRRIEERVGLTIREIFETRGEAAFREEEQGVAREVLGLLDHVVAAGGGAFAHPGTRELLGRGALTVWLRCSFETVLSRIAPEPGIRPLAGSRETMLELFVRRQSSYRLADRTVDASRAPDVVARQVAGIVRYGARRPLPGTT